MREIRCKRIIDGKTYNTETATQLGGWTEEDERTQTGDYLFQSRYGAFFRYRFQEGGPGEDEFEAIDPLSPDAARKWIEERMSWNTALIEQLFGEMPEAGSGEVKFTLRMPESLKMRLAAKAEANKQSLNAWIIRCLEGCAGDGEKL